MGSSAHEQCVTCCPVSCLVNSPGCAASVITWKISSQDASITILRSQLTRLARLSCNRKVYFCCIKLTEVPRQDLCKANQPDLCNQVLSFIARFYALPTDLTDCFKPHPPSLLTHTPKISAPKLLHTPFSILNELSLISMFSPYKYYQK